MGRTGHSPVLNWHIVSAIPGILWPAVPAPNAATKLSSLFQLDQSQWWSAEKLRHHQFQQLRPLLRHCIETVPYYRKRLAKQITPETLSSEEWQQLPILTRDAVQQAGDQLHSRAVPPQHGKSWLQRTSGSTGKPVESYATVLTNFFWNVLTLRDHLWHQRDLSGKLAVIRFTHDERAKAPHGFRSVNWGRATEGLFETGESSMIDVFAPIPELAAWLERENPDYLLSLPSVIQDLALYCREHKMTLPALREVRTLGEALPHGLRELCQNVWGVKICDIYSTIELGYLALQCPDHEHYHVQSEGVILEILNDEGRPCGAGEVGRVVATTLHNYATPLIRYEVGDFAEAGEACDCGRGLPVIKRIQGRYRNLLTLPSGDRRLPELGIQELYKIASVRQFQAAQLTLEDIEIRLVLPRPLSQAETDKLTRFFQQKMGEPFNITIRQVKRLQRSAGGKYEEFISEL
jgi:phenylacetate-CoA ligase